MITEIAGKKVSAVGLGTFGLGGSFSADSKHDSEEIGAIKHAINSGITFIDTAEMYGSGHSEELVGKAIENFDREDLFITTKFWKNHHKHDDVIKAAKASLSRLGSGYIDLYLIHWPNHEVPVKETLRAMEGLVDEGIVRSIGVSNFNRSELEEAMESTSKYGITANQIQYSLAKRSCEDDIIPYCEKNNVKVIAYSPLDKGSITGRKNVAEISGKLGKSPAAVALNYLARRSLPIPKSSSKQHINDFVEAMNFEISDEDYDRLRGKK